MKIKIKLVDRGYRGSIEYLRHVSRNWVAWGSHHRELVSSIIDVLNYVNLLERRCSEDSDLIVALKDEVTYLRTCLMSRS